MKEIKIGALDISLDSCGRLSFVQEKGGEPLESYSPFPLFRLDTEDGLLSPLSLTQNGDKLVFAFEGGRELLVNVTPKSGYAVFKAEKVTGTVKNLIAGPIFTAIDKVIGDVVGVVQGEELALGIQALNDYTIPGFPRECERLPEATSDRIVSALSVDSLSYFESAAFPATSGSLLQVFAENRRRKRSKTIMGAEAIAIPPMTPLPDYDGGVEGLSFALFCCKKEDALKRIGEIELGEGLPHPMLDGEWAKTSRKAMSSYLITEFNTENIEKLLGYTKKAGLNALYHPEPFDCWGNFTLRKAQFPQGDSSMKECCEKAAKEGVRLGVHTLTAFTTTNDPYVTPVPNEQLADYGSSELCKDISADSTELLVEDTALYQIVTTLQTVKLEEELITYNQVEEGKLTGCVRGAFGTKAAPHSKGTAVKMLCDYPYKVFFPNIQLQEKYTSRLVELFCSTGLGQISFDGLEGCNYSGEDLFAQNRFCNQCFSGWGRPDLINDASRLLHNLWHMHTRMNWGEPWGSSMREGQTLARIKNQDFYRRNLFPRMLGWFLIRKANRKFEATSLEDLEWALSMAAGFDAGFALFADESALDTLGCTDVLLESVKNWEDLRLANMFSPELQERLRDPKTEWHLTRDKNEYKLYPMAISEPMVCDLLEMQPGQPGGSDWVYENPFDSQPYSFRMHIIGNGEIINPSITTPLGMVKFSCRVSGGQYLLYRFDEAGGKAVRTDRNYRVLEEISFSGKAVAAKGHQHIAFSCDFAGEEGPEITVNMMTYGEPILLTLKSDK